MELKPGYKLTEVGVVPHEWAVRPLGDIATIATGSTPPTSDVSNYGDEFLFVSPADMGNTKQIAHTERRLSQKGFSLSRQFPKDSILFVCIGSTIGKCAIASVELTSNQQINAIYPSAAFLPDFLYYAVSEAAPRVRALAGEQAVPLVNKSQFSETKVALPLLPEQCAIAAALNDVDAMLSSLDALIAKKRDIKQAAMQQLLTGKTRLPGFAGEWAVTRLGDHATLIRNGVYSRAELSIDGSIKYLHYGDIHTSGAVHLNPSDAIMPFLGADKAVRLGRLVGGDLVFVDATEDLAGVGKSVEVVGAEGIDVVAGLHTIAVRFDKRILADGFKAYLQFIPAFGAHLRSLAAGTKVLSTNRSHIASAEIALPSIAEQTAIAEVLSDMDAELAALGARRDKTRLLKQGMMQELLTGKTRLV